MAFRIPDGWLANISDESQDKGGANGDGVHY